MSSITNEQLLKEIRRVELRVSDLAKHIKRVEQNIIMALDKPVRDKPTRKSQVAGFSIENVK